ncbi:MAG: hypothetical protein K0U67_08905 [Actinomycetia bacterium]|nr:hypothetical protein [Actinomycetes bacterium]
MGTLRRTAFRTATAALLLLTAAPAAAAPPECTDVGISTRVCTTGPGHTAITTTPDPALSDPGPGWGFGTLGIPAFGLGGGGVWVGF